MRVLGMSDALSEGVEDLTVYHGVHSVECVRRVGFEIEPVDRRLYERTQKAIADDVTLRRQRARGLRARASSSVRSDVRYRLCARTSLDRRRRRLTPTSLGSGLTHGGFHRAQRVHDVRCVAIPDNACLMTTGPVSPGVATNKAVRPCRLARSSGSESGVGGCACKTATPRSAAHDANSCGRADMMSGNA